MTEIQWKIVLYPTIILVIIFLNFCLINSLIIPDVCYYHTHEMNFILNLFYTSSSASGGHPEPNFFNFLFTLFIGFLITKFALSKIRKTKLLIN